MEFDREQVMGTGRLLLAALVLSLPGLVAFHFERTTAGLLLLVVALLWVSVGALGLAVGERGFLLPWRVAYWLGKRPLGLAAATLGWWAAGFTEVGVKALAASSTELWAVGRPVPGDASRDPLPVAGLGACARCRRAVLDALTGDLVGATFP